MKADVAIITALGKELEAILNHGKERYGLGWKTTKSQRSKRIYHQAANKMRRRIVAVQAHGMGQLNAAIVTNDVISDFSPNVILLVGIAAGIADHVQLGDIVISGQVIDYELGKLAEGGFRPNHPAYQSNSGVLNELKEYRDGEWKRKILSSRPDGKADVAPNVHVGDIFCGNKVVADQQMVSALKKHFRGVIALEMESAGIAALLNQRESPPHFAMIKAICDRANGDKDDRWQQYAADAAASFTLAYLESYELDVGSAVYRIPSQAEIDEQVGHVIEFVAPDLHSLQDFQKELVGKVVTAGLKEVGDVLSGRYQADVGLGRHFLLRAGPLFGKASRIYATSLDTVSSFWTNPDNKAEAGEYLRHQAPGGQAMRLFVFSDADTAHKHCKVLDAHEQSYGHVYLCSMPYYQTLLRNLIPAGGSVDHLLNRDFAVLSYGGAPNFTHHLFAELDSRSLSYQQITLDEPGKVSYRAIIELFERWQSIPEGQFDPADAQVLRWERRMWMDHGVWASALQTMFNERTSDAIHMVFFRVEPHNEGSLRELLADIKQRLATIPHGESLSMMARYGIKRIWIGRKMHDQQVRDKLYNGLITATPADAEPYILIMRFDTEDGLTRFYTDKEHSEIRREVFEKLDSRIKILYDTADSLLANGHNRAVAYEAIEALAGRYIHRRDYLDDEMIDEMVRTVKPYDF